MGVFRTTPTLSSRQSLQGTIVTDMTGTIIDSFGSKWTLIANPPDLYFVGQNGNVVLGATWVVMLVYWNRTVYYEDQQGGPGNAFNWYYWNVKTNLWIASPTGDPRGSPLLNKESLQGTEVTDTTTSIIDSFGNVWTLVPNPPNYYFISENSVVVTGATFVTNLLYWNHLIYYANNIYGTINWFYWSQLTLSWISCFSDPRGTGNFVPSANGTIVTDVTRNIVDSSGNIWNLVPNSPNYYLVSNNGSVIFGSIYATAILYWNNMIYFQSSQTISLWFIWNGSGWTQVASDPRTSSPIF